MGLISILNRRSSNYASRRFLRTGNMASARIDAAAVDVFVVRDSAVESMNILPDIIVDATLDGSASDSISSSIAASGISASVTGGRAGSVTDIVNGDVSTVPTSAASD